MIDSPGGGVPAAGVNRMNQLARIEAPEIRARRR